MATEGPSRLSSSAIDPVVHYYEGSYEIGPTVKTKTFLPRIFESLWPPEIRYINLQDQVDSAGWMLSAGSFEAHNSTPLSKSPRSHRANVFGT